MLMRWSPYEWPFTARTGPWSSFDLLRRQMDRVLADFEREVGDVQDETPATTLRDTGDSLVLRAELPGLSEKDLEITANATTLTLRGERKDDAPEGYTVHRKERSAFQFGQTLELPCRIEPDRVTAVMKDGVLTLTLPKAAEARPKQIAVTVS